MTPAPATPPSAQPGGPKSQRLQPLGSGIHSAFDASLEFFLSPLMPFIRDPDVNEIMVNGASQIYVERNGQIQNTTARFASEADVQAAAYNIAQFVGLPLTNERPLLDGRLPDGSRVCIVLAPIAAGGTQIAIRRFARASVSPEFLLEKKAITPMALEFLMLCVKGYRNILASGGAGSGKTTLVNVLTNAFSDDERIIVIEDTRELKVQKEHVVQLEARPADQFGRGQITVRDLFITALRMRPDRIVVGEVRRGEALDMIQAMTSGHHGSLTTLHASSPADTCRRLETMALMADIAIPLPALRRQIASAVDIVVQVDRMASGQRLVTSIAEVDYDEDRENYIVTDIFRFNEDATSEKLAWTGLRPKAIDHIIFEGLTQEMALTKPMMDGKRRRES